MNYKFILILILVAISITVISGNSQGLSPNYPNSSYKVNKGDSHDYSLTSYSNSSENIGEFLLTNGSLVNYNISLVKDLNVRVVYKNTLQSGASQILIQETISLPYRQLVGGETSPGMFIVPVFATKEDLTSYLTILTNPTNGFYSVPNNGTNYGSYTGFTNGTNNGSYTGFTNGTNNGSYTSVTNGTTSYPISTYSLNGTYYTINTVSTSSTGNISISETYDWTTGWLQQYDYQSIDPNGTIVDQRQFNIINTGFQPIFNLLYNIGIASAVVVPIVSCLAIIFMYSKFKRNQLLDKEKISFLQYLKTDLRIKNQKKKEKNHLSEDTLKLLDEIVKENEINEK